MALNTYRRDAQKSGSTGLSETGFTRLASWYERKNNPAPVAVSDRISLRAASLAQASEEASVLGFSAEGSRFYRKAHTLWSLERTGKGFSLIRTAAEPGQFAGEEGAATAQQEIPSVGDNTPMVAVGTLVTYPLGGEVVRGKVVASRGSYVDVDLGGQVDQGVPVEMVRVAQGLGANDPILDAPESPIHDADKDDKAQMGLSMHPEAAKRVLASLATYGAVLADEVVGKTLNVQALERVRTASRSLTYGGWSRPSTWSALTSFAGAEKTKWVRNALLGGVSVRTAARELGLPFAMAWELGTQLLETPRGVCKRLVAALKGDEQARHWVVENHREKAVLWANAARAYQAGETTLQKTAVDKSAEDYWTTYFGDYGATWVREIKRRVRADLLSASLVRQGVDQAASDYWADYFGEYGDQLVGDVDRAVRDEKEVKPNRDASKTAGDLQEQKDEEARAQRESRAMPLPQPISRQDIFASYAGFLLDEQGGSSRVAVAKKEGTYKLLVRVGEAQKEMTFGSEAEVFSAFRSAVRQHLG